MENQDNTFTSFTPKRLASIRSSVNQFSYDYDSDSFDPDKPTRSLCLDMTFYFRGDGDFEQDILNFQTAALECLEEKVRYYLVDMEGRFKKANKNTPGLLPRFVEEKKDYYNLILETGAKSGSFTDRAIQINVLQGGNGYVRLVLPVEFITEHGADAYVDLVKRMATTLQWSSGMAGLGINQDWHDVHSDVFYGLSQRFMGIDLTSPNLLGRHVPHAFQKNKPRIAGINWLTLLDKKFVKKLGGVKHLRKTFSKEIIVHDLPGGVLVQAGSMPATGDLESGETLPLYYEVGRVLKDLIAKSGEYYSIVLAVNEEYTEKWMHRFDSEQDSLPRLY